MTSIHDSIESLRQFFISYKMTPEDADLACRQIQNLCDISRLQGEKAGLQSGIKNMEKVKEGLQTIGRSM